jgi:predicted pyridoxine 5'-phosphate oxidase superfamily flavin-nucleotide-binding protein
MGVLTDEMKQLIERQRLGFVATVCPDGTPNLSPKGTVFVLDDDHLMFADIRSPGTVANLRVNPSVEVNVVDPFVRKGYRFKGRAEVLEAGAAFERLVAVFVSRGVFDAPRRIRAIVVVRIDQARPLISPGYDRDTDEASVRAHWVRHYIGDGGAG